MPSRFGWKQGWPASWAASSSEGQCPRDQPLPTIPTQFRPSLAPPGGNWGPLPSWAITQVRGARAAGGGRGLGPPRALWSPGTPSLTHHGGLSSRTCQPRILVREVFFFFCSQSQCGFFSDFHLGSSWPKYYVRPRFTSACLSRPIFPLQMTSFTAGFPSDFR